MALARPGAARRSAASPSAVVTPTAVHSRILKPSNRAESTRRWELVGRINYAQRGGE